MADLVTGPRSAVIQCRHAQSLSVCPAPLAASWTVAQQALPSMTEQVILEWMPFPTPSMTHSWLYRKIPRWQVQTKTISTQKLTVNTKLTKSKPIKQTNKQKNLCQINFTISGNVSPRDMKLQIMLLHFRNFPNIFLFKH